MSHTQQELELLAGAVAQAREVLSDRVTTLQVQLDAIKRQALPGIRQAVRALKDDTERLRAAVSRSPNQFVAPKTRVAHGVRYGITKQRGKVVIADEAKTISLIRELLPK